MINKRVILLAGHYGSGKTNIAVNIALALRRECERVLIADLDIVNPYFRTKDSADELSEGGVRLLSQQFANSNVDLPALPPEMYAITDDQSYRAVVDIGGDDRGAYALGRFAPALLSENNYEMLFVANFYRPLTRTAEEAAEVMAEIHAAGKMPFTGIINNSNLGAHTDAETVIDSVEKAKALASLTGLPLLFTAVREDIDVSLTPDQRRIVGKTFPLTLQKKYFDIKEG